MRKEVRSYINSCLDCQSSKITRHTKPFYKSYGEHPKFSAIHVDYVGPLPANNGKRYLFTVFDRTSRWFHGYPTSAATTAAAITCLLEWISMHGVPTIITSDQGRHFESSLLKNLTHRLGIEKRRTTAYHPQSNGAVENQHRRLKDALKAKSITADKKWRTQSQLGAVSYTHLTLPTKRIV